jgi:hypothetical protein
MRGSVALRVVAGLYLAGVWLDGVGSTLPAHVLPRAANYFLQIAALFPRAATMSIDYRAEAWVCADKRWEEFDTRPYFPLDPDDKENRFQRVMHFYRQERTTMHALDAYLIERHASGKGEDGIDALKPLGGVRLMSLRIPLPTPGEPLERNRHLPLAEYPKAERHFFYHTPRSKVAERCGVAPADLGEPSAPRPAANAPDFGDEAPHEAHEPGEGVDTIDRIE